MRVNAHIAPIIVIVALLGTVGLAGATGLWSVTGRTEIDVANMKPDEIKGWMTLQQLMDGFKLSQEQLYKILGISADIPSTTAMKDLEKLVTGFETSTAREALNAYFAGSEPAASTPEATPEPVATAEPTMILTPEPTPEPTPDPVEIVPTMAATAHVSPTTLPEGVILPADQIKGRMTLREVSTQCAVPVDKLLNALQLPADTDLDTQIKTLVSEGKISEVSQVQQAVAVLQGK